MAVRALWKGVIRLEDNSIPVKLYSAVQDKDIHFRLLHQKDNTPVRQVMIDPETNKVVSKEEIRRGYRTEDGDIVILNEEELDTVKPESSRDIEVLQFFPGATIPYKWYKRAYYLGPDGDNESYFAFIAALKKSKSEGLVRWVMRDNEYFGSISMSENSLVLIALRYTEEVISVSDLKPSESRDIDKSEQRMAEQLISAMEDKFEPKKYRNEYREKVLELIDTKAKGGRVSIRKFKRKEKPETDLKSALEKSVRRTKERKSA